MPASRPIDSRAHLNYGICRYCWGTGEVSKPGLPRLTCPECVGLGARA